ncbi:MAG: hypothetical protein JXA74_01530 [Anaerolineae bacterium]|nr:hypothetical protein [Anaerolineae bacterium]
MRRRWIAMTLLILVSLLLVAVPALAASINVVRNGSFEGEFVNGVGSSWQAFNNGGNAAYGYRADTSESVVYDGMVSQLITIHTLGFTGSDADRYAGIYQVVPVVPGERYMFSFYGMVRSTEGNQYDSNYNYRVEIAYDYEGRTDPWAMTDWEEMDRWAEFPLDKPGLFQSYAHGVTPTTNRLTIFIRAWKKFPTTGQEARINIDAVSLLGPDPGRGAPAPSGPRPPAPKDGDRLPDTGAGSLLPLFGAVFGLAALGLTGARVLRKR